MNKNEYSDPVNFIDLAAQQNLIKSNIENAIKGVLDHGQYIMGPEVKKFEEDLQNFSSAKHAITCANGTDALTIALMALNVSEGDAIFVPSFSYVATVESPALLGASPFFVDVEKGSFNIDPESFKIAIIESVKLGLTPKAVIPVDLFGQPANLEKIIEIAHNSNIKVIEDAAQSFGAKLQGKPVGSIADITTTSFFPAKPLGCYGDGGAIFTNDDNLANIISSIRLHGKGSNKYDHIRLGMNSRLDTIQAAILIEKLKIFPNEIIKRNELAAYYNKNLESHDLIHTPLIKDDLFTSTWAQYSLKTKKRDEFILSLKSKSIPTAIYYPVALSSQPAYKNYPSVKNGCINSQELSGEVFSIPMHPYLTDKDRDHIIKALNSCN